MKSCSPVADPPRPQSDTSRSGSAHAPRRGRPGGRRRRPRSRSGWRWRRRACRPFGLTVTAFGELPRSARGPAVFADVQRLHDGVGGGVDDGDRVAVRVGDVDAVAAGLSAMPHRMQADVNRLDHGVARGVDHRDRAADRGCRCAGRRRPGTCPSVKSVGARDLAAPVADVDLRAVRRHHRGVGIDADRHPRDHRSRRRVDDRHLRASCSTRRTAACRPRRGSRPLGAAPAMGIVPAAANVPFGRRREDLDVVARRRRRRRSSSPLGLKATPTKLLRDAHRLLQRLRAARR